MQNFLKLGKYTINPNAIAYIDWDFQHKYTVTDEMIHQVRIYLQCQECGDSIYLSFAIDSPEAKALASYYDNPHFGLDLLMIYPVDDSLDS